MQALGSSVLDNLLVLLGEVRLELFLVQRVLHLEAVVLESVLGLNLLSDGVVLSTELVGICDHLLDLLLRQAALIVSDCDLFSLSGGLVTGADIEDTVGVDVESDLDLWSSTRCGRNAFQVELAEQVVVLGHLTLTLVDLDQHSWLVIGVRSESLLLLGGDASVAGNKHGHYTTGGLNALRQRGNIEEKEVLHLLAALTAEDSSLNGGTVCDGLIGVDRSVELFTVEEVLKHGLDLGDTGAATDKHDLVDLRFGDVGILEDLLDGRHALAELGHAELLELSTADVDVKVLTLGESLAVDLRLMRAGQDSLGLLALSSETTHSTSVALDVNACLLLKGSNAEVD